MKVIVMGCGLVGQAIVRDLAETSDLELTVVDADGDALDVATEGLKVERVVADLREKGKATSLVGSQDLVVGAVPGWLGLDVVREVIEAEKPIVDISFMPEDALQLDDLAKQKNVAALVDFGVAPGTSNMLVGRASASLDEIYDLRVYVGGLPRVRYKPFEYGVVFSPCDVIEEYTRPAFIIENGQEVVRPALSELELIDVPGVGTLEAFLTDGLRTLRQTIDAPNMIEKTLRYPGHCEKMRLFVETGLFDEEPITIGDKTVCPRDVTAKLLERVWTMDTDEEDMTILHVDVRGNKDGEDMTHSFDLIDSFDREKGVTSMARTTGYACTAAVRLVTDGKIDGTGVIPPEIIGRDLALCDDVLAYLAERGIMVSETVAPGA